MSNVHQLPDPRRPQIGPTQRAALLRWHGSRAMGELLGEVAAQPRFPLIDTGGAPIPGKPRRSRRPSGGQGGPHVA